MKVPILDPGGLFKDYELHKVNSVSCEMEDMDAIPLNYWFAKFVMELKVAKDSGERYPPRRTVYPIVASFRLDYEYEIEYEYDFSILVFRLHIITTQTNFNPWATLST